MVLGRLPQQCLNPVLQKGFIPPVDADNMLADAAGDIIKLLTTCMTLSKEVAKALCLT